MLPRVSRKHRYPKKKNLPRLLAVFALPLLLITLLVGSGVILRDDANDGDAIADSASPPAGLSRGEAYPAGPLPASLLFDKLLVEKNKRKLTAFFKNKPMCGYLVALGKNPLGPKEIQGDKRTPEGIYTIDGKNPKSAYYKNLGISYPNEADRAHAKTLKKSPGGDLKIHGLAPDFADIGQAHRLTDWTDGCIAVTNDEMEELYAHTPVGASIEILP